MTAAAIQTWLVARLSAELSIPPSAIDVREPLASYGLDSMRAVALSGELEEWLDRRLSPTLAYEYPTIEQLAAALADEAAAPEHPVEAAAPARRLDAGALPIAIVGIGCRFPGAEGVEAFWRLLRDGVDAIREVPDDRWEVDAYFDADASRPGTMNTRWGGFLDRVDLFDPYAFGIAPREAARMDPQQRLLLESAWEALEDAGQPRSALRGTRTGVFIGISSNDYGQMQFADPGLSDPHAGTGNALSIAANRLSYLLDLRGPSLAVDTACSSSLVAVHLACRSLRSGECAMAIAGGVNVILSPAVTVNFTKAGFMAPDGRCKAFDARADGYVRGEGAGVVILKPLAAALADGDPIYAVIRGTATNSDGRTNGLTAPSRAAQEAVIREAYRDAGISPGRAAFVECHGTGTALGDPIEAMALGAVLAEDRPGDLVCAIGSVKTNIGHLEAAAGVAGLIKAALALAHREIPPSLHYRKPHPYIPFETLPLRVQERLGPLPDTAEPAVGGVSAFGFGGTNAHVVLEEAPRAAPTPAAPEDAPALLLPLSAHSPAALRARALALAAMLDAARDGVSLRDICYTAAVRRDHLDHRLAVAGAARDELGDALRASAKTLPQVAAAPGGRPSVAFVFCGQGPQWWGMGRELLAREPAFREAAEACDAVMRAVAGWSVLDELASGEAGSRLDRTEVAQPAMFLLQVALVALWRSWGVEPDAVIGHSMGEVAAACVAGALSLEEAARVIVHRGRVMAGGAGRGRMAAVDLPLVETERLAAGDPTRLWVAAVNSPTSTVLAGEPQALGPLVETLRRRGVFARSLPGHYAFHSPQMDPFREELVRALDGLSPGAPRRRIVSTVTGEPVGGHSFDATYWGRNIREPVRFAEAVDSLVRDGVRLFVEVGPHPVLSPAIEQCLTARGATGTVVAGLRRGAAEGLMMRRALGRLYAAGVPIDWRGLHREGGRCVRLPAYPWQRERCWTAPARWQTGAADVGGGHVDTPDGIADLFYHVRWEPLPDGQAETAGPPATWIILADRGGVGAALATRVRARGDRCVVVTCGAGYAREAEDRWTLDPLAAAHFHRLVVEAVNPEEGPHRIAYLWGLDEPTGDASADEVQQTAVTVCAGAAHLAAAVGRARWAIRPRLWLVTRGAQAVGTIEAPESGAPTGGALWGLGRIIAEEHALLWGGLVDLDPGDGGQAALSEALWNALAAAGDERELALRDGRCFAARLARWSPGPPHPVHWRPDAAYLVTGGLGDLGLEVARWMVRGGARRVILLGRTPLPPRASWREADPHTPHGRRIAAIRAIEALGASVHLVAADVGDEAQLRAALDRYADEGWPPIRGVVHAAGVGSAQVIDALDPAALDAALRPKVAGAWALHRLMRDADLDVFLAFSSLSAVIGSPRLGAYAAANAFLDALAHRRRALGLAALSVNWGFWEGIGMAARSAGARGVRGAEGMKPHEALTALGVTLGQTVTQVSAARVDWPTLRVAYARAASAPILRDLLGRGAAGSGHPPAGPGTDGAAIRQAPPEHRLALIEGFLRDQVAGALQIPLARLDVRRSLPALGLDSIMAVQLKNGIEAALGVSVDFASLLEGASVASLAAALSGQMNGPDTAGRSGDPSAEPGADALLARVEAMSDEEVDALLHQLAEPEA